MRRQRGQSMAEYLVVTSALVSALLYFEKNSDCPGYDNCIASLLTVMHDNYDGYSASMSAVHKYGDYSADVSGSDWGDGDGGSDGSGGGSSGGGVGLDDGLTQISQVTSNIGDETYGTLQSDGSVTNDSGDVVGYYDEDTGFFVSTGGGVDTGARVNEIVLDEDGNVLQLDAFTSCSGSPKSVYSFGYESKATGKFYDTNLAETSIDGLCTEPSYKVVDRNGDDESGRIVDGLYYAITGIEGAPLSPTGEVVYWADLGDCAVMVDGWDDGIDTGQSAEDIYADQLALYSEPEDSLNPRVGSMSAEHYVEQTAIYGEDSWPNNCVSSRTISQP